MTYLDKRSDKICLYFQCKKLLTAKKLTKEKGINTKIPETNTTSENFTIIKLEWLENSWFYMKYKLKGKIKKYSAVGYQNIWSEHNFKIKNNRIRD